VGDSATHFLATRSSDTGAVSLCLRESATHTFYYEFTCGEHCAGHKLSVVDWELVEPL